MGNRRSASRVAYPADLIRHPAKNYPALGRLGIRFAQVAARNLNVAVISQLLPTNLPLGDDFERDPVQMIRFEATLRRWGNGVIGIPASIRRKAEEHCDLLSRRI
jgi:hypothetical protein